MECVARTSIRQQRQDGGGGQAGEVRNRTVLARLLLIEGLVAEVYGISPPELLSEGRGVRLIADARQLVMYLAHVALGLSCAEVGDYYGRDRSTVAYACRKWEDRRDDPQVDAVLFKIEQLIAGGMTVYGLARWEGFR